MSQINVTSSLRFTKEETLADLREIEAEIDASIASLGSKSVKIPLTAEEHIRRAVDEVATELSSKSIAIAVEADDKITDQVNAIRAAQEATPIVIPVELQPTGGGDVSGLLSRVAAGGATISASEYQLIADQLWDKSGNYGRIPQIGELVPPASRAPLGEVFEGEEMSPRALPGPASTDPDWRFANPITKYQPPEPEFYSPRDATSAGNRVDQMIDSPYGDPYVTGEYGSLGKPEASGASEGSDSGAGGGGMGRGGRMAATLFAHFGISQLTEGMANLRKYDDISRDIGTESNAALAKKTSEELHAQMDGTILGTVLRHPFLVGAGPAGFIARGIYGDPDDAEQKVDQTMRETQTLELRTESAARQDKILRGMSEEITTATQGGYAGRLVGIDNELTAARESNRTMSDPSKANAAAEQWADIQRGQVAQDQRHAGNVSAMNVDALDLQGNVAGLRASGLDREASVAEKIGAIDARVGKAAEAAQSAKPEDRADRQTELNAAIKAAAEERKQVYADEARDRKKESDDSTEQVIQTEQQGHEARLRAEHKFHEASIEAEKDAVANRIEVLQKAYDRETEPQKKAELGRQLAATRVAGASQNVATDDQDKQWKQGLVNETNIAVMRDELEFTPLDFGKRKRLLEQEWDDRFSKADQKTIPELQKQKTGELDALSKNRDRVLGNLDAQTQETRLQARGDSRDAELYGIEYDTKQQLASAGGDQDARQKVIANARARTSLLETEWNRPQMFSSMGDYLGKVQADALIGTNNAADNLKGWKGALSNSDGSGIDQAISETFDKFGKFVDKVSDANVAVIQPS